ncbi:MAG TPA: glycosyltransferase [Candidatus Dormibacteraeota bacterium]|nr:glycosyltransferase [Candidatus Dormibacteraeota bacterium]
MPIHIVGWGALGGTGTRERPTPGLSLCMIVRDEEALLDACLSSACAVADEICIADTGSTDRTLEIARAYGAKIRQIPWTDDFSEARNASLEMATRTWVLFLDADEVLEPQGHQLIRAIAASEPARIGFNLRCVNEIDEHRGGGETSHLVLRLFPNHPELRFVQPLHEYIFDPTSPLAGGVIRGTTIDATIRHRGYLKRFVEGRNKRERNLAIARAAVERHPEDPFHWYGLGQSYGFAGRRDEAVEPLERMRECAGPDDRRGIIAHGLALLGEIYANQGKHQIAEERARDALRRAPGYPNGSFALAIALRGMGRQDEAVEAYRAAYRGEQDLAKFAVVDDQICTWKARCELGVYLAELGRLDEAVDEMAAGVARAPEVMAARINYAHVLEKAGRLEQAEGTFSEAFKRHPVIDSALQHVNFLLRRGRREEALRFVESAIGRVATDRERHGLHEARAQLCALEAASALERLTAGIAAAAAPQGVAATQGALPEGLVDALREDRWADAADVLLRQAAEGIEEDRLRVLCAYRLGERDIRANGLLAAVSARPSDHVVRVAQAVCRAEPAGPPPAHLQAAVALLATRLLLHGRKDEARRVADAALAVHA